MIIIINICGSHARFSVWKIRSSTYIPEHGRQVMHRLHVSRCGPNLKFIFIFLFSRINNKRESIIFYFSEKRPTRSLLSCYLAFYFIFMLVYYNKCWMNREPRRINLMIGSWWDKHAHRFTFFRMPRCTIIDVRTSCTT